MATYQTPNIGLNKWAETDYFKRVEINENFDKIDDKIGILSNGQGVNIESFPRLTGETDDSGRFTRALNSLGTDGGYIVLPQGKVYTGTFTISRSNVTITGGGILKGTINLYGEDTTGQDRFSGTGNIRIEGITIDGETIRNGINVKWIFNLSIRNVSFKNCVKAIYFEPIPQFQHSSRIRIINNHFVDCNYGLYVDWVDPQDPNIKYLVGDVTFSNNMYESRNNAPGLFGNTYHIWAKGLDGLVCKGNTFFFAHTGNEKTNIYIDTFNWVIIEGNELFEAGEHGVYCLNGSNLIISNNNVAWAKKEMIRVSNCTTVNINNNNMTWKDNPSVTQNQTGVLVENCAFFCGSISNNSFMFPNEYAIKIVDSSFINISGNNSRNKYSTLEPVGINTFATCGSINISGNQFTGYTKKLSDVMKTKGNTSSVTYGMNNEGVFSPITEGVFVNSFRSYTNNSSSIDISGVNLVVLANKTPTTITSITTEDLNSPLIRFVTIYSYNANTSISKSIPNVVLKGIGETAVTIPAGGSITFMVYGGTIREINRSFPITSVTTISTTDTTLDASVANQFNLNQPSTTTITAINNGTEGQMITLIAFNGNTTISNTATINLKGAVNATIPNKGVLRLLYTAGAWYEISRNF